MHHNIPLPRGWNRRAKSAILHILALSHYTFTAMLARAAMLCFCVLPALRPMGQSGSDAPARQGKRGDRPPGVT